MSGAPEDKTKRRLFRLLRRGARGVSDRTIVEEGVLWNAYERACASVRHAGDAAVELSVTHTSGLVGVAFCTRAPVGIDVEDTARPVDVASLRPRVLNALEPLDGLPGAAFFTYWVRKEALVKASGAGLHAPLHELVVSSPADPPRLLRSCPEAPPVGAVFPRFSSPMIFMRRCLLPTG